jgi:ABC-2 type transport system ATP-binding protein
VTEDSGKPAREARGPARSPSGGPAIEAHGLARSFDGTTAVEALDLTVNPGEMFCIVGPDGAGKSTTVRLLCGILEPTAGSATVLGLSLTEQAYEIRTRVGYLSQEFTLYGDLTVDENIEFFAMLHGVSNYQKRRNELLSFTRLTEARQRLSANLSGGMKKKLALACTLIHTPEIVFLDEPSTGVDPVSRGEFWSILSDILAQGITIVLTTPYLDEAERCDRVALLYKGRFIKVGPPDEMRGSMPGAVFVISTERPREAYMTLRQRWSSSNVVLVANSIRFWSDKGRADGESAVGYLTEHGYGDVKLHDAEPTLDDTFVALLAEQEEAVDRQREERPAGRNGAEGIRRNGD